MALDLSPSQMYGHWTHREPKVCEFQHGSTMIYVSYNDARPMESRLAVAQSSIAEAFNEVDCVLDFARQISEKRNPEFWQSALRIPLKQRPLVVFALRYPIDSDLPIYEISWNPIFMPECGTALSEGWVEEQVRIERLPENREVMYIKRTGPQQYAQVA